MICKFLSAARDIVRNICCQVIEQLATETHRECRPRATPRTWTPKLKGSSICLRICEKVHAHIKGVQGEKHFQTLVIRLMDKTRTASYKSNGIPGDCQVFGYRLEEKYGSQRIHGIVGLF